MVLRFKKLIDGHNPLLHPNMNINEAGKIAIFCNGLHPEAKIVAIQQRDNIALARQNGCCYPAQYPAGHPNAGVNHPNANNLSFDLLALYVHRQFVTKVNAGLIHLNSKPGINLTSPASPADDQGDKEFLYVSWHDVSHSECNSIMALAQARGRDSAVPLKTCKNCGGVNHFSHKDGVLVCPTPESSVPVDLLRRIQYPFGVRPWRFGGGKGGKGKGSRGRGSRDGGRGRGGFWTTDDGAYWYWSDAPAPAPPVEDPPAGLHLADDDTQFITDDYADHWNE